MTSVNEILQELSTMGNPNIKANLTRQGTREPFGGVKIADLKKIQKRIKVDHELALKLFDSGNSDAMYLAGLISDPLEMTPEHLNRWAKQAYWHILSEYTVAQVTAESLHGEQMAKIWIESEKENIASAGWAAYSNVVSVKLDAELDLSIYENLLNRLEKEIHHAQNRVRYTMNSYVIAVGCFIAPLTEKASACAEKIGRVKADMGETSCKVPDAAAYIRRVKAMGRIGKKRKQARC